MRKHVIINWTIAVVVSILIGLATRTLMGGSIKMSFMQFVWNAGYSLCLGLPLFANGYLFNWFEKRYIDWINRPGTSVIRALLMHFVYSSLVIWTVNWFWFIYIMDREWASYWKYNSGTIIGEYIIFIIIASIIYAISFFKAWRNEVQQKEEVKTRIAGAAI